VKICPSVFAVGDDNKKRKGREGKVLHNVKRVIFQLYGERTTLDRFLRKLAGLRGPAT